MVPGPSQQGDVARFFRTWLRSPTGWARANIVYNTLRAPPTPNTPLELICIYVFHARQRAEYMRTLLTLPASQTEEAAKAREELVHALSAEMFPFQEQTRAREAQDVAALMERIVARGPEVVTPLVR